MLEAVILNLRPGTASEFEAAFRDAQALVACQPGYQRHELRRCVESTDRYLLLIWWDRLESHTEGFRRSPEYERWKAKLHSFYEPFPEVEHYASVSGAEGSAP